MPSKVTRDSSRRFVDIAKGAKFGVEKDSRFFANFFPDKGTHGSGEHEAWNSEKKYPDSSAAPINLHVTRGKEKHSGKHFNQEHENHLLWKSSLTNEVQVVVPNAHYVVSGQDDPDEHDDDDEDPLFAHEGVESHGKEVQPSVARL